jgi:hypothetical protein
LSSYKNDVESYKSIENPRSPSLHASCTFPPFRSISDLSVTIRLFPTDTQKNITPDVTGKWSPHGIPYAEKPVGISSHGTSSHGGGTNREKTEHAFEKL